MRDLQQCLIEAGEPAYREFQSRLMPTVPKERILGVRIPLIRKLARTLTKEEMDAFLAQLPHRYYDENNLHAVLICGIRDYDRTIFELERFFPYIDNWATCDIIRPKAFDRCPPELKGDLLRWIGAEECYTVRFGIEMMMTYFLDDRFTPDCLETVAAVQSEEYYINMMIAWFFATALAKQYDASVGYLRDRRLAPWVHRKTIQKAVESNRITPAQKEALKAMR